MTQLERDIQARLVARKEELSNRMVRLDRHVKRIAEPLTPDFAEQAVERQNDEVVDALWKTTVDELREVNDALGRLAEHEYGDCERCGKSIQPMRLQALPCTTLCSGCARELLDLSRDVSVTA
jgi:RNA polymerase-binding transcription factor DksA